MLGKSRALGPRAHPTLSTLIEHAGVYRSRGVLRVFSLHVYMVVACLGSVAVWLLHAYVCLHLELAMCARVRSHVE